MREMKSRPTSVPEREKGFTLIELLIVVVTIGVLAAISVPWLTGRKQKIYDATAQDDIRSLVMAEEAHYFAQQASTGIRIEAGGSADLDGDGTLDFQANRHVELTISAYPDGYRITAKHVASQRTWCLNSSPANAEGVIGQIIEATTC